VPIKAEVWPEITFSKQDMIVFVSQNAVACFVAEMPELLSPTTQLVAVGAATARCMVENGLRVDIQAPAPAGSESLLALSEMNAVAGKAVLIVRGETGRELLADTLRDRGARIEYLEVYQRCLPHYTAEDVALALKADTIVITSVAGLENLCQIVGEAEVKHKTLIVVSERIRQIAAALGFQHIAVTDDVSDTAVVHKMIEIGQNNGE
jgi:uroporphyrinogen-III synthase